VKEPVRDGRELVERATAIAPSSRVSVSTLAKSLFVP